jgi:hypothetical protein
MTFQFSPTLQTATNSDLGLLIQTDPGFYDGGSTHLQLTDLPSGRAWVFPIEFEKGQISYVASDGLPRTHESELACHISRRRLEPIVHDLVALKAADGRLRASEEIFEAIRLGVFEFLTYGGYQLKFVSNYSVSWVD